MRTIILLDSLVLGLGSKWIYHCTSYFYVDLVAYAILLLISLILGLWLKFIQYCTCYFYEDLVMNTISLLMHGLGSKYAQHCASYFYAYSVMHAILLQQCYLAISILLFDNFVTLTELGLTILWENKELFD